MDLDNMTPEDVKQTIDGYDAIEAAIASKTHVESVVQNNPVIDIGMAKCSVLHEVTRKDEDGADCKLQIVLPVLFGNSSGMVCVRVEWGDNPPKNVPFSSLGEAVEVFCKMCRAAPTSPTPDILTHEDVKQAIGDCEVINVALMCKAPVKDILQHKPTVRISLVKNYVLYEKTRKDRDGLECKLQILLPTVFDKPSGMVWNRMTWGDNPPRSWPYTSLDEAVEEFCAAYQILPVASREAFMAAIEAKAKER